AYVVEALLRQRALPLSIERLALCHARFAHDGEDRRHHDDDEKRSGGNGCPVPGDEFAGSITSGTLGGGPWEPPQRPVEVDRELFSGTVTFVRLLAQRFEDDRVEIALEAASARRRHLARTQRLLAADRLSKLVGTARSLLERRSAAQQ